MMYGTVAPCGVPGLESFTFSPLLSNDPTQGPKIGTLAGMLYLVRNVAGSIPTTRPYPLAGSESLAPKVKSTPSLNFQPLPLAASNSENVAPVRFCNSINSSPGASGLYMISLMTTGPYSGSALAAPGVGVLIATKSVPPVLLVYRPNEIDGAAAPKST